MNITFGNMTIELNIFNACSKLSSLDDDDICDVSFIDTCIEEIGDHISCSKEIDELTLEELEFLCDDNIPLSSLLMNEDFEFDEGERLLGQLDQIKESSHCDHHEEEIEIPLQKKPPTCELKPLPSELKYAFLGVNETYPIIISSLLEGEQEQKLLEVLRDYKGAIGWSLEDIKGISPSICTHRIHLEDDAKPSREPQRRLNPHMQEVVRAKVLKLLDAGMIYPISDSKWVSPTQVVPKKAGITVVENEKGELVATRVPTKWRVCIDYRKLNSVTRKDHFPLPFIDQMLERLAGRDFYCFLDGYSGYNQIAIDPMDQEKTTFTCPFGTFAYRRMPFGLCNAPATFQRCMLSIFSDMVEKSMEVFMDDFSVDGSSFDHCL